MTEPTREKRPQLYGADYSVYVRIARLALLEKGVAYDLVPVDIFAEDGIPVAHRQRHPFGKIPTFEHGDFHLYETGAITRYVDEAFDGPALQAIDAKTRGRMNQIISIADGYVIRSWSGGCMLNASKSRRGGKRRMRRAWRKRAALPKLLSPRLPDCFPSSVGCVATD